MSQNSAVDSPIEKATRLMDALSIRDGALRALRLGVEDSIKEMNLAGSRASLRSFNADLTHPHLSMEVYLADRIHEVKMHARFAREALAAWLRLCEETPAHRKSRFSTPAALESIRDEYGATILTHETWAIEAIHRSVAGAKSQA